MNMKSIIPTARRLLTLTFVAVLLLGLSVPAQATENKTPFQQVTTGHNGASFTYDLILTDQNGMPIENPRTLAAGDTLRVEIRLSRDKYTESTYDSYGIEFRLLTRGLTYNYDGTSLRGVTEVTRNTFMDGDSVGFSWYDMTRQGEAVANPVLAASWSYTVDDPAMVNITVPVSLVYIPGEDDEFIPVGNAILYLDVNGGKIIGKDVSGEYPSGTAVILPDAEFNDYVFEGWSDGYRLHPAGSEYVLTGVVTLTAQWADLVRNRYVRFVYDGGQLLEKDPSGSYADGEIIIMPAAVREGYRLVGWTDNVGTYAPGEEYEVYNTVNIFAIWELIPEEEPVPEGSGSVIPGLLGGLLLAGLLWWIILLWKRRWVKYSLVNGDIALDYTCKDSDFSVTVVLIDDDDNQHTLGTSAVMPAEARLRFIKNLLPMPIAPVEKGHYKGKLIITAGTEVKEEKCRIKVLEEELEEQENK